MPMDRLDGIVIGEVSKRILVPDRLVELLDNYSRAAVERGDDQRKHLAKLRIEHGEAEAGINRLLELVEKGVMAAEDQSLRERLIALKLKCDELAKEAHRL